MKVHCRFKASRWKTELINAQIWKKEENEHHYTFRYLVIKCFYYFQDRTKRFMFFSSCENISLVSFSSSLLPSLSFSFFLSLSFGKKFVNMDFKYWSKNMSLYLTRIYISWKNCWVYVKIYVLPFTRRCRQIAATHVRDI